MGEEASRNKRSDGGDARSNQHYLGAAHTDVSISKKNGDVSISKKNGDLGSSDQSPEKIPV
jgi:hypothetical protein